MTRVGCGNRLERLEVETRRGSMAGSLEVEEAEVVCVRTVAECEITEGDRSVDGAEDVLEERRLVEDLGACESRGAEDEVCEGGNTAAASLRLPGMGESKSEIQAISAAEKWTRSQGKPRVETWHTENTI